MRARRGRSLTAVLMIAGIGLVAGLGWKLGWIEVDVAHVETGQLEESPAPPPDSTLFSATSESLPEDPFVLAAQSEPPVQEGENFASLRPSGSSFAGQAMAQRWDEPVTPTAAQVFPPPQETAQPATRASYQSEQPTATVTQAANEVDPRVKPSEELNLAEIQRLIDLGDYLAAHRDLSKIYWNHPESRPVIQDLIEKTSQAIFFAPQPQFIEPYVVQAGDRLTNIAAKYKVPWQYLAKVNGISDPARIRAGQKLKVIRGPFSAVVDLKDFALTVHLQGYYVKRYSVGIGKDGSSPIGKFSVLEKLENPQFTDPNGKVIEGDDPANPLGERWIDLGNSYGIHGTIEPDSIGKAASRGCVRMRNEDVAEVYDLLSVSSEVVIRR